MLILSFASTWAIWVLVIRIDAAHTPSTIPRALVLGGPVFLLGVFAPALIAIALTAVDDGRSAVADLLRRIVRWRIDPRLYAFALLLMPITKLVVAVLDRARRGRRDCYGYPAEKATRVAVETCRGFATEAAPIEVVQFACFSEEMLQLYRLAGVPT